MKFDPKKNSPDKIKQIMIELAEEGETITTDDPSLNSSFSEFCRSNPSVFGEIKTEGELSVACSMAAEVYFMNKSEIEDCWNA